MEWNLLGLVIGFLIKICRRFKKSIAIINPLYGKCQLKYSCGHACFLVKSYYSLGTNSVTATI